MADAPNDSTFGRLAFCQQGLDATLLALRLFPSRAALQTAGVVLSTTFPVGSRCTILAGAVLQLRGLLQLRNRRFATSFCCTVM